MGGNLQLCVCESNSQHSRPSNSCFCKGFRIGDWGGSVTAHILDMYGYGYDYMLGKGSILAFIWRGM